MPSTKISLFISTRKKQLHVFVINQRIILSKDLLILTIIKYSQDSLSLQNRFRGKYPIYQNILINCDTFVLFSHDTRVIFDFTGRRSESLYRCPVPVVRPSICASILACVNELSFFSNISSETTSRISRKPHKNYPALVLFKYFLRSI